MRLWGQLGTAGTAFTAVCQVGAGLPSWTTLPLLDPSHPCRAEKQAATGQLVYASATAGQTQAQEHVSTCAPHSSHTALPIVLGRAGIRPAHRGESKAPPSMDMSEGLGPISSDPTPDRASLSAGPAPSEAATGQTPAPAAPHMALVLMGRSGPAGAAPLRDLVPAYPTASALAPGACAWEEAPILRSQAGTRADSLACIWGPHSTIKVRRAKVLHTGSWGGQQRPPGVETCPPGPYWEGEAGGTEATSRATQRSLAGCGAGRTLPTVLWLVGQGKAQSSQAGSVPACGTMETSWARVAVALPGLRFSVVNQVLKKYFNVA